MELTPGGGWQGPQNFPRIFGGGGGKAKQGEAAPPPRRALRWAFAARMLAALCARRAFYATPAALTAAERAYTRRANLCEARMRRALRDRVTRGGRAGRALAKLRCRLLAGTWRLRCRLDYRIALARAQAIVAIDQRDMPLGVLLAQNARRVRREWRREQWTLRPRAAALRWRGRLRVRAAMLLPNGLRRTLQTQAGIQDLARACTLSFSIHTGDN